MKNWGSAIFPLSVLLVLAALTFWLRHAIELPEGRTDGKTRHDPDYIIDQPQLRKLDKSGRLQYTLNGEQIRHYPDDDSTTVVQPRLRFLHPRRPPVLMDADRAEVSRNGEQVDFHDNVVIRRPATPTQAELIASMPTLTVLPDAEKAFTKSPVQLSQGKSWLKGVGMQVDGQTQTYILESQAVGQFESKHARKR